MKLIFGFLVSLLATGCCVYHPQTTDIPLIKGKNDLRIDAGISLIPAVHATISYGLTNKVALQAFGTIGDDSRQYFQFAPGLYKDLGKRRVMELYGGFGAGYGIAYKDAHPGNMYGDYQLYFLQYNLGRYAVKRGDSEFGFGIKTGYFHSNLTDRNYYAFISESGPFIKYKENSFLIEPMFFYRIGGDKVKFTLKAGVSKLFKLSNPDNYIPYMNLNLGFGINFNLKMKRAEIKKQDFQNNDKRPDEN